MIHVKLKHRCNFCDNKATMTVKAPFATPVSCCDQHQFRGWAMGERAVDLNVKALNTMASPWLASVSNPLSVACQVQMKEVFYEEVAQASVDALLAASFGELDPTTRALAIADMRQRGKAQMQRLGALGKMRDRRRGRDVG